LAFSFQKIEFFEDSIIPSTFFGYLKNKKQKFRISTFSHGPSCQGSRVIPKKLN
jgi:hypothetical protein